MKWVRTWLVENFGYSKKEANGSVVLLIFILTAFILSYAYDHYQYASYEYSDEKDLKLLEAWASQINWREGEAAEQVEEANWALRGLKRFDPNKITEAELLSMNFPKYVAANWGKYVGRGGKFYRNHDLLKLYGMDTALYLQVEPYLFIESVGNTPTPVPVYKNVASAESKARMDINSATIEDLQKVRGIGPTFSERIVKYRKRLGGFARREQLREVYGLKDETIEALWAQFEMDSTKCCAKLPINQVVFDSLRRHPYLNYNQARAIIAYREQHGSYSAWTDLAEIKILPDSVILKIKPYFDF